MKFYPVQTTSTAAYFVDAQGKISELTPTGTAQLVGNLSLRSGGQPDIAFAVSPDGAHFMASILTFPAFVAGASGGFGSFSADSHWYYDLEVADPGQPPRMVISRDLGVQAVHNSVWPYGQTMLIGWDDVGPVATTDAHLWGQGRPPTPSLKPFGPHLVHLAADGAESAPIAGSDCVPVDELANATALCTDASWSNFSVREANGRVLWNRTVGDLSSPVILSPDGSAAANYVSVFTQNGGTVALPGPPNRNIAIYVQGWVNAWTVIGDNFGELVLFDVSSGGNYTHLGTSGSFVGVT
jgi:hypothetical protein